MATAQILVTGGSGFVGKHLLTALSHTSVLTPDTDICDAPAIAATIAEAHPSVVLHLAAIAAPAQARQDPAQAWQVNLQGTLNVARAVQSIPGCTLIFISSADAYGATFAASPLDEQAPLAPLNTYAATKAAADLALGAMVGDGLRILRLRPFNHTGPGQSASFVVPAFARQLARIEAGLQPPLIETGALDPVRDFLDVRDVCAAYAAAITRAETLPSGTILNIASGIGRRVGDVLQDLIRLSGITADIRTDTARLRPSDVPQAIGNAAQARRLLAWAPQIAWEQTLQDVLTDWRARIRAED